MAILIYMFVEVKKENTENCAVSQKYKKLLVAVYGVMY